MKGAVHGVNLAKAPEPGAEKREVLPDLEGVIPVNPPCTHERLGGDEKPADCSI